MRLLTKIGSFIFLLLLCNVSRAFLNKLPPEKMPIQVKVGLFINNVSNISERNETIEFNATLAEQWYDPRLAFVPILNRGKKEKIYDNGSAISVLDKIWRPQLILLQNTAEPKYYATHLLITSDGKATLVRRFHTKIKSSFDFHNFPFDSQKLVITVQSFRYGANVVELVKWPQYSGFSTDAHLEDWHVTGVHSFVRQIQDELSDQKIYEYVLSVDYFRNWPFYVFQVFLPIFFIVLLSFSVFWMTHNPLVNRVAISMTAILTIVVFQWRILGKLPQISYHTFLDVLMHYSLFIAGFALITSVIVEKIEKKKPKAELLSQIFFPIGYMLGLGVIYLFWFKF